MEFQIGFEDVIGEPDATQGFEGAYRLSFGLFQFVRFWVYRILMFILSVPLAFVWAVVFALLSLVSVWLLTPAFRVVDIAFFFIHRVSHWNLRCKSIKSFFSFSFGMDLFELSWIQFSLVYPYCGKQQSSHCTKHPP